MTRIDRILIRAFQNSPDADRGPAIDDPSAPANDRPRELFVRRDREFPIPENNRPAVDRGSESETPDNRSANDPWIVSNPQGISSRSVQVIPVPALDYPAHVQLAGTRDAANAGFVIFADETELELQDIWNSAAIGPPPGDWNFDTTPPATGPALDQAATCPQQPTSHVPFPGDAPEPLAAVQDGSSVVGLRVDAVRWPDVVINVTGAIAPTLAPLMQQIQSANRASQRGTILAVTSCQRGEGRTTIACSLARCAVDQGMRVALFDADVTNPSLTARLGLSTTVGWEASGDDAVPNRIFSRGDQLTVVPLSGLPQEDNLLTRRLEALRKEFDLVVVDLPSVFDAQASILMLDPRLLLVHDGKITNEADLRQVYAQLQAAGIDELDVAENCAA